MENIQDLFNEFEQSEDIFAEFDKQEQAKNVKTVSDTLYPETFEGKYLQPIYDIAAPVAKGLSVLEKPLSTSMAVGKTIGKGINELSGVTDEGISGVIDPLKQELMSGIFPSPENTISSGLRDLEIGTDPIVGDALSEGVKAQFPKASALVSGVAPVDIADMAMSGAYGAKLPKSAGNKLSEMKVGDSDIAKSALIRGSQRDVKFVGELKESGKLDTLASKVISDPALRKRLSNPDKMVEYLQGVTTESTDKLTGARSRKKLIPGKLDESGQKLSESIKKISKDLEGKKLLFDTQQFTDGIVKEIMDDSEKIGSGKSFDPEKIRLEVEKYTKSKKPKTLADVDKNRVPYSDLVEIKRGAANNVFEMKRAGFANVDNPTFAESVAQKVWSKADNEINAIAESFDDFDVIKNNNEFSDYQKIRELYANKDIANKYIPSLLEDILPMAVIGGGAAAVTGSPYMGLIAAGGYPMARSGASGLAKEFPSMALNTRMGYIEPALKVGSMVKPGFAASVLASTQIPRNTNDIIAMKDQFIAKIAMETKTPEGKQLFDEVVRVMETNPEQIEQLLPALMKYYPNAFKQDPYGRINNKITDPVLKEKAIKDIVHREGSALEKAKKTQMLINQDILED